MRRFIGVLVLLVILALCAGYVSWRRQSGTTEPSSASVAMDGTTFVPGEVTVTIGDTVTWTNKDPFPHNVSSKPGGFASETIRSGGEWSVRPSSAGRFSYVCTLHPGMAGTLIVRERSSK